MSALYVTDICSIGYIRRVSRATGQKSLFQHVAAAARRMTVSCEIRQRSSAVGKEPYAQEPWPS